MLFLKAVLFISFMVFMALGRFSCDKLRSLFGRRRVIRTGGFLSFLGLLLVVLAPSLSGSIYFATLGKYIMLNQYYCTSFFICRD